MILVVTIADDFHALAIGAEIEKRGGPPIRILECDRLATGYTLRWGSRGTAQITDRRTGQTVDTSDVRVIWWRRVNAPQRDLPPGLSEEQRSLITNDSRGAMVGLLGCCHGATWVSDPASTERASNKLLQLSIAQEMGFTVPETLVAQSKSHVLDFERRLESRIVVKPVVGTGGTLLFTQYLDDPADLPDESFELCPAIYQEYVPGTRHLRVNVFGERVIAAMLDSPKLDWRPDLNIPVHPWQLDPELEARLIDTMRRFGLRMGIVDLKLTDDDRVVWLEVNPQGQFLFLEGLTDLPMTVAFADFICDLWEVDTKRGSAEG